MGEYQHQPVTSRVDNRLDYAINAAVFLPIWLAVVACPFVAGGCVGSAVVSCFQTLDPPDWVRWVGIAVGAAVGGWVWYRKMARTGEYLVFSTPIVFGPIGWVAVCVQRLVTSADVWRELGAIGFELGGVALFVAVPLALILLTGMVMGVVEWVNSRGRVARVLALGLLILSPSVGGFVLLAVICSLPQSNGFVPYRPNDARFAAPADPLNDAPKGGVKRPLVPSAKPGGEVNVRPTGSVAGVGGEKAVSPSEMTNPLRIRDSKFSPAFWDGLDRAAAKSRARMTAGVVKPSAPDSEPTRGSDRPGDPLRSQPVGTKPR